MKRWKRGWVFLLLQTTSFHHSNALACVAAATWNTLSPPSLPVRLPLTPRCSPAGGWADRVLHSPDPCVCHLVSVLLTPSLDWLLMGRGYLIVWCHQPRMHSVQRLGESLEEDIVNFTNIWSHLWWLVATVLGGLYLALTQMKQTNTKNNRIVQTFPVSRMGEML